MFFPNSISFGVFSHSEGFGAELLSDSHGSLGKIRLGPPEGSAEGYTKVPARVHQGSTKVLQVSWCLWFSGTDPSWAAKRFCGRFHRGFTKVPPRFFKFRGVFGFLGQIRLGLPKGSVEGSPRFHMVPPRLWFSGALVAPFWAAKMFWKVHQGFTEVSPRFHQGSSSFVVSLVFLGRSVLGCQKVQRYHVSPMHLQSAESGPSFRCCWGILWAYFIVFSGGHSSNFIMYLAIPHSCNGVHRSLTARKFCSTRVESFSL